MTRKAVILTYLEWTRLIRNTWIRFNDSRIVSLESDLIDSDGDYCFTKISELMRQTPDVDESSTGFILLYLNSSVHTFERHYSASADLGQRLKLSMVESFNSLTNNALMQHEFDAKAASIKVKRCSDKILRAWSEWVAHSKSIADTYRSELLLTRLGLCKDENNYEKILQAQKQLDKNVEKENDKVRRSQDTMAYGWIYILNALKCLGEGEKQITVLSSGLREELEHRKNDFDTAQSFLSNTQSIQDYVNTYLQNVELDLDLSELLAIATFKQYERYIFKNEGRNFICSSFEEDVRILKEMSENAAVFFVYQTGAYLHERDIESMGRVPVESIREEKKLEFPERIQADLPGQEKLKKNEVLDWIKGVEKWTTKNQKKIVSVLKSGSLTIEEATLAISEKKVKNEAEKINKKIEINLKKWLDNNPVS